VLSIGGGELVWLPEIGYGGRGSWRGRAQAGVALRLARAVTAGSHYAARPLQGPDRALGSNASCAAAGSLTSVRSTAMPRECAELGEM
jgi:hypothetical protein